MTQPWDHGIANKWPAARAVGPDVTAEQALEFIFRTDRAFSYPEYSCNDRMFRTQLSELLGYSDDSEDWTYRYKLLTNMGHISLQYLDSHWVASNYIGGPHGLVSPLGEVSLAKNFGKWPSTEVIESDLEHIKQAFPWLTFRLWLWDSPEEAAAVTWGSDPTHAWEVTAAGWQRIPVEGSALGYILPAPASLQQMTQIIKHQLSETTWSIDQIEEMWGDRIRAAIDVTRSEMAAEGTE